jgi:hypothetical protein
MSRMDGAEQGRTGWRFRVRLLQRPPLPRREARNAQQALRAASEFLSRARIPGRTNSYFSTCICRCECETAARRTWSTLSGPVWRIFGQTIRTFMPCPAMLPLKESRLNRRACSGRNAQSLSAIGKVGKFSRECCITATLRRNLRTSRYQTLTNGRLSLNNPGYRRLERRFLRKSGRGLACRRNLRPKRRPGLLPRP